MLPLPKIVLSRAWLSDWQNLNCTRRVTAGCDNISKIPPYEMIGYPAQRPLSPRHAKIAFPEFWNWRQIQLGAYWVAASAFRIRGRNKWKWWEKRWRELRMFSLEKRHGQESIWKGCPIEQRAFPASRKPILFNHRKKLWDWCYYRSDYCIDKNGGFYRRGNLVWAGGGGGLKTFWKCSRNS